MTQYLTGLTEAQARAYQRGLYMLSQPNADTATKYFGAIIPHSGNGTFAAELDPDAILPLDITADASQFAMDSPDEQAAWDALVATLSQAEWDAMATQIQAGQPLTVSNFIPEAISGLLVDAAAATAAGYPINT